MPLEVRDLRALEGPNVYYPVPAVKLQVWADRDLSRELSDAVKQWSQQVGVVIGALRSDVRPEQNGVLITLTWTTPLPNVGERIAEGVVADLQAAETRDDDYSHDEALFAAIAERKREEPSLAQLQLFIEAQVRELPMVPAGDGKLMFGSGSRGFLFDPSTLSLGMSADIPWDSIGTIPIVAVTGTNGKTTTTRLIAHVLKHAGRRVGRTDTDGIWIDGTQVEDGDWAGWGGARRVITDPGVDAAVLETSRGGILRRGLGFSVCDVAVVTNVSADHLGELGVTTPAEMAWVKGVIVRATRADGAVVLNADDPLVLAMRENTAATPVLFSRDPDNAELRALRETGGAAVWSDGAAIQIDGFGQQGSIDLADIPLTFGGAAAHNVENCMAAIGACLGLKIPLATIAAALGSFRSDATHNANRLNVFERPDAAVVFDYAHNEAGMRALIAFGQHVQRERGGRLLAIVGGPGDRTDDQIVTLGQIAAAAADHVWIHEEERYLRGREPGETTALYRQGAEAAGLSADRIAVLPDELAALNAALDALKAGDVVVVAAHAQRDAMLARLGDWAAQPREGA